MKRQSATTAGSADASPAIGQTRRTARFGLGALLSGVCLLVLACANEPPHQSAFGDEIAIGPYALSIQRARNAPNPPPPISSFRTQPGKKCVVVFVYWKKLDQSDRLRSVAFIESFLENQLSIEDSEGKRTKAFSAMQERLMYMEDPGSNWRDWVVVFHVTNESRDLTLRVANPEPREDQARVTAVSLGI